MKNQKYLYLIIIILSIFYCCQHKEEQVDSQVKKLSKRKIQELVDKNSDRLVFLRFWGGMSNNQYQNIKDLEIKEGNLESNGKFLMKNPDVPFTLWHINNGIKLNYYESKSIPEDIRNFHSLNISNRLEYYNRVNDYLFRLLDKKYVPYNSSMNNDYTLSEDLPSYSDFQRDIFLSNNGDSKKLGPFETSNQNRYQWIDTSKADPTVITLTTKYEYIDYSMFPDIKSVKGNYYSSCNFTIEYQSLAMITDEIEKKNEEQRIEMEERRKKLNKEYEHNSNL